MGNKITVGTLTNNEVVSITSIAASNLTGTAIDFTPALVRQHMRDEGVVAPGTGLDLTAPLKFNHAANLPFSDRGTGISFQPATVFAHSSNEPIQAVGSGIVLDRALSNDHAINTVVRDPSVKSAGYQGTEPNQWFGGPELTTNAPLFGRTINVREGSLVLRDTSGLVVDSLNYGGLVDPWAAEGYQASSGPEQSGCYAPAPGAPVGLGSPTTASATNTSTGRFPDGVDTDSNCTDFLTQAAATLSASSDAGATNIKVASVEDFQAGQKIMIDAGANLEHAIIAKVGTAGATNVSTATSDGTSVVPVAGTIGFRDGEAITIDSGSNSEKSSYRIRQKVQHS